MKKFLVLAIISLLAAQAYSQREYRVKNRYFPVAIDESLDGVWEAPESSSDDRADSVYIYKTGLPDFYDLEVPDLELKMKSLWYDTKVFFLFRHLDDSLVNGYINDGMDVDTDLKEGLENRDATAVYLFLDNTTTRLYDTSSMYHNGSYADSIAWFRFVWGANEVEGALRGEAINSLEDLGGEMIQWSDGRYRYAKFSIDIHKISSVYANDSLKYNSVGFEVELTENDKDSYFESPFGIQTRAFWSNDLDSVPMEPRNVLKWGQLTFTYGDTCISCIEATGIYQPTTYFAKIFPNPASVRISAQLDGHYEAQYRIFSLMGQQMLSGTLVGRDNSIELDELESGTYYINIITSDGLFMTEKLLIFK